MPHTRVFLRGCPRSDVDGHREVDSTDEVIKIESGPRREHFAATGALERDGDRESPVFVWSHCTYVAE